MTALLRHPSPTQSESPRFPGATNGTGDLGTVTDGQPVMLVRYRPGITTNAGRTVHLMPLPVSRNQVRLSLAPDTVALIIPTLIATEVTEILTARRCLPPVLDHPYAPEHRVLLAGEPYPVALAWPTEVHRVTATLLLPPSVTPMSRKDAGS